MFANQRIRHFTHLDFLNVHVRDPQVCKSLQDIGDSALNDLILGVTEIIERIVASEVPTELSRDSLNAIAASTRQLADTLKSAFDFHIREVASHACQMTVISTTISAN